MHLVVDRKRVPIEGLRFGNSILKKLPSPNAGGVLARACCQQSAHGVSGSLKEKLEHRSWCVIGKGILRSLVLSKYHDFLVDLAFKTNYSTNKNDLGAFNGMKPDILAVAVLLDGFFCTMPLVFCAMYPLT